jgi:hypothetical protein
MQPAISAPASAAASSANVASAWRKSQAVPPMPASRSGDHIHRRYQPAKQTMNVSR